MAFELVAPTKGENVGQVMVSVIADTYEESRSVDARRAARESVNLRNCGVDPVFVTYPVDAEGKDVPHGKIDANTKIRYRTDYRINGNP